MYPLAAYTKYNIKNFELGVLNVREDSKLYIEMVGG
jgi:hypothetical protein